MKRLLITILTIALLCSAVACGSKDSVDKENDKVETNETTEDTNVSAGEGSGSLKIIETVWNALGEESKFYCVGGNMNAGTAVENAPADFGVDKAEDVDNTLGFPAASIELIDEAANLIHGMNANNFTMAVYHVTDKANLDAAVKAIDDNLATRQWVCGFPEKLMIATIDGEYVVSIFGATDIVEPVKSQLLVSYPDAAIALEKNMME